MNTIQIEQLRQPRANIEEIQNSQRMNESNPEFDSEIMSIIGSINSRAQELRSKFNLKGTKVVQLRMSEVQEDPLKNIVLELSEEVDDEENQENHLEQTIIIGEMEEGNIFSDFKHEGFDLELISISK